MKLVSIAMSALSVIFAVHAATVPNVNEDSFTIKEVIVTCESEQRAINCRSDMIKVEGSQQDKFSGSTFTKSASNFDMGADFLGSCTKANEVLRTIKSCNSQDCPKVSCGIVKQDEHGGQF